MRRRLVLLFLLILCHTVSAQAGGLVSVPLPAATPTVTPAPAPTEQPVHAGGLVQVAALDNWATASDLPGQARWPGAVALSAQERNAILANGHLQRSAFLDAALSLVEEGNPFLERYNLLTGASIQPLFEAGVPYFFGGGSYELMTSRYPEYTLFYSWQDSLYYRKDELYFFGFDCNGFTRWVWREAGKNGHASLSTMLFEQTDRHLLSGHGATEFDWNQLPAQLEPGDLLVMTHPGYHVAMFLGTLRAFGYTADEVPELADYLDYPLVIHSGVNAAYADRFTRLQQIGPARYQYATVTDGGVTVSLLGLTRADAPHLVHQQKQDTSYFLLPDHTWLTILPWSDILQWCWFR